MEKVGSEICPCDWRVGLQLDGCLEVLFCLRILRERGVDESQKLMDLKAFWGIGEEML